MKLEKLRGKNGLILEYSERNTARIKKSISIKKRNSAYIFDRITVKLNSFFPINSNSRTSIDFWRTQDKPNLINAVHK